MLQLRARITLALTAGTLVAGCMSEVTNVDLVMQSQAASAARYSDWSPPVNLGPIVNSTSTEQNAQLSKDGLALYFSSDRPGGHGALDLYVARRASEDSPWEAPINLGALLNSSANDFAPNLSLDGHLLFWASGRPGTLGGADLWMSRRDDPKDDLGWGEPVNLGAGVNTAMNEQAPNYHQNAEEGGGNLYFNRGNAAANQADLYYVAVSRSGVAEGPAVLVTELSTLGFSEQAAVLRHDAKEVFFFSNRASGLGGADIYTSSRQNVNDSWSAPVNVAALNTTANDVTPNLSFDGRTLLLGSNRPGSLGGNDIYMTFRTRP